MAVSFRKGDIRNRAAAPDAGGLQGQAVASDAPQGAAQAQPLPHWQADPQSQDGQVQGSQGHWSVMVFVSSRPGVRNELKARSERVWRKCHDYRILRQ